MMLESNAIYDIKIDIMGHDVQYFCYWLAEHFDEWDLSIWFANHRLRGRTAAFTKPLRTAPHRISSVDWKRSMYKVRGIPNELYTINTMMYNDIDAMAVKLAWQ